MEATAGQIGGVGGGVTKNSGTGRFTRTESDKGKFPDNGCLHFIHRPQRFSNPVRGWIDDEECIIAVY